MKRLFVVVGSLLVLPAFAEVAPQIIYDDGVEYIGDAFAVNDAPVVAPEQIQQPEINQDVQNVQNVAPKQDVSSVRARARSTVPSRLTAARSNNANVSSRSNAIRRSVSSRNSVAGNTNTAPRTVARASVVAPNVVSGTSVQVSSSGSVSNTKTSVLGGGTTLYNGNPRVAVSNARVSSRNSGLSFSASNSTTASAQTTTEDLDKLAEATDYYKAQYALCMDNYCNVLDDNQGRCSCSANLANYAKTEEALTEATEALQEIAQQIQYIGLSAEDVETLFKETEAELQLASSKDNSNIQSSLDKIKRMIVEVKTGKSASSSAATTAGLSMDLSGLLDFSFDNTGFDLSSLLTTTRSTANTNSISNQRGTNLYKTAAARCKASVLNSAAAQGVDVSVISNSYDLEIDKACFAYERALTEANANMNATVRNATSVLQKARLMVAQNKNVYDLRGCVEALDSCMQSDFVCGTDYEGCLDTTGKYIVDGEVVVGSTPGTVDSGTGLYATTWGKDAASNPWRSDSTTTLSKYISASYSGDLDKSTGVAGNGKGYPDTTDDNLGKYLLYRIGFHNDSDNRNYGMCVSVLNQCQNYTYTKDGKYRVKNAVLDEYLTRTLPRIKAVQDEKLAEYAESCISDVETCLSNNGYSLTTTAANTIAMNACKSLITTCKSVNVDLKADFTDAQWVQDIMNGLIAK